MFALFLFCTVRVHARYYQKAKRVKQRHESESMGDDQCAAFRRNIEAVMRSERSGNGYMFDGHIDDVESVQLPPGLMRQRSLRCDRVMHRDAYWQLVGGRPCPRKGTPCKLPCSSSVIYVRDRHSEGTTVTAAAATS